MENFLGKSRLGSSYQTTAAKNLTNWNLERSFNRESSQEFSPREPDLSYRTPKRTQLKWILEKYTRLMDRRNRTMEVINSMQTPLTLTMDTQRITMTISTGIMILEECPLNYESFPHIVKAKDIRLLFIVRDQQNGQPAHKFRIRFRDFIDFDKFVDEATPYFKITLSDDSLTNRDQSSFIDFTRSALAQTPLSFPINLDDFSSPLNPNSSRYAQSSHYHTYTSNARMTPATSNKNLTQNLDLDTLQSPTIRSTSLKSQKTQSTNFTTQTMTSTRTLLDQADDLSTQATTSTRALIDQTSPSFTVATTRTDQLSLPWTTQAARPTAELAKLLNDETQLAAAIQSFLDDPQCRQFTEACARMFEPCDLSRTSLLNTTVLTDHHDLDTDFDNQPVQRKRGPPSDPIASKSYPIRKRSRLPSNY